VQRSWHPGRLLAFFVGHFESSAVKYECIGIRFRHYTPPLAARLYIGLAKRSYRVVPDAVFFYQVSRANL